MNGKIERMKAREEAQQQAKADRSERKEHAGLLADEIRLQQLRSIPKAQRSEEEQKEFQRLYQRSKRRDQRGEESPFAKIEDAEEFWAAQRETLSKVELNKLVAAQELVRDQEFWMKHGFELDPSDLDYVNFQEGLADLQQFVAERGIIHDCHESYDSALLRHFDGFSFALWNPRDYKDRVFGNVPAFFKLPEFDELCHENPQTATYAKYGIKTALLWSQVAEFKRKAESHKSIAGGTEHWSGNQRVHVADCWLCGQEKVSAERKAQG